MAKIKLRKCPICNSEVVFDIFFDDYTDTIGSFITCRHCDLKFYGSMDGMSEEQLTDEWNTRIPMDRIMERLEENSGYYGYFGSEEGRYVSLDKAIEIIGKEM